MLGKWMRKNFRNMLLHYAFSLPDGEPYYSFRRFLMRRFGHIGKDVILCSYIRINHPDKVFIEDGVCINRGVILDTTKAIITIKKNTIIAPYCVLRSDDHNYDQIGIPIKHQFYNSGDIVIGENCWLGTHVVVLRGIKIGMNSIIGAGAVVTKDIPSFSVAVGVPAKVIKRLA